MVQWWRAVGRLREALSAETSVFSRSYHTIQAVPREVSGRKVSSKERAQGRIPAIVFAQEQVDVDGKKTDVSRKQLLSTERKQIQSILKSVGPEFFRSTTFKLQIRAGLGSSMLIESGNVLPVKLHRDKETGKILNLVFNWVEEGSKLTVNVPIVFKGEDACPGIKKGGQLYQLRSSLKLLCPAEHIPQKIEVDISNLDIGDKILLNDVNVDASLKLLSGRETKPVCKIVATDVESITPVAA